ncbi:DUF3667 domain-containing protein [Tamlana sp. 2_MG-2023]|uniref:DUF3667 domain-containing protein n=1 Tax=unclassified Tamlana TaxID=2614803 RepID=UPI0026E19454|nr:MULTISPECIES: DUF3667 domain-containing protein [unclassified Tamlana]MDO6759395.1 DUF3667 domain-containing protein [Tamlana sp. 2_MG-2023]MDO6790466.1 DUF3667 domain-containing protein [Tamlana sp. 1_MG-2023]
MKNKEVCKNCEKKFKESYRFCPYCGQQAKDELTVKVLFYNTINNYFAFDARFYKSFFPLLFKPGYLATKFIEGKRLMYLHPAQMYLFVSIIFYFLFSFVQSEQVRNLDVELKRSSPLKVSTDYNKSEKIIDSLEAQFIDNTFVADSTEESSSRNDVIKNHNVIANFSEKRLSTMLDSERGEHHGVLSFDFNIKLLDSLIVSRAPKEDILTHMGMSDNPGYFEKRFYTQALRFYETRRGGSVLQTFYDAIPIAMFFLLPVFAFILKSFYFKRGLYAEYLVFSFYYFSFIFTVLGLMLLIYFMFDVPSWVDQFCYLTLFVYLLIAIKNFYKQRWLTTLLKTFAVTFIFLSIVIPITVVILSVFAFLFY